MDLVKIGNERIEFLAPVKSGVLSVFSITDENESFIIKPNSALCFDSDFSSVLHIRLGEEFASILKAGTSVTYNLVGNNVKGWGIGDPYVVFDENKSFDEDKIVAKISGKYSNFFLRNCSIMEGDTIIISREEFDNFDRFFKNYNKRNNLSMSVEYLPYNPANIARAKTKMIDESGVIDTPIGYMFVLKTICKHGTFEISASSKRVFIPRFKEF